MLGPVASLALLLVATNPRALDCTSPVPPTDIVAGRVLTCEQATATAEVAVPIEALKRQARDQLVKRLCKLGSAECESLAARVKDWQTGTSPGVHCAQAVVCDDALAAWRDALAPELDLQLQALAPRLSGGKKAVIVRGIDDAGTRGGARASWLLNRLQAALSLAGVSVVEPPAQWNGARPVKPAERMVRAELVERLDPARQLPVVEATWKSSTDGVTWQTEAPLVFPAAMAPPGPQKTAAVRARGDDIVLHVDARKDGSLCNGDRTQVYVTNRGTRALHVRVLNLDAAGHALVLFPNDQRQSDVVAAGATVTLGDDAFEIAGEAGDRERYVVLAAEDVSALGRFARVTNANAAACRLPAKDALRAQRGEGLDAPVVAETGFTIVDDAQCKAQAQAQKVDPKLVAQAVEGLVGCW